MRELKRQLHTGWNAERTDFAFKKSYKEEEFFKTIIPLNIKALLLLNARRSAFLKNRYGFS